MATDYEDYIPYILPEVIACPSPSIMDAVRSAAIEFCEQTHLWRNTSEATDITEGVSEYSFTPPDGAKVVTVVYAEISSTQLVATSVTTLDEQYSGWRTLTESVPSRFFVKEEGIITLVGEPSEDITGGLIVDVILKPSRASTSAPDFLFEDWVEVIAEGALARLQGVPGKLWSDRREADRHRSSFERGMIRAKTRALKGGTNAPLEIKPRSFGSIIYE